MVIYKTINLINGKFYVGKDRTNNPNYIGSGLLLKQAIKKYGRENFIKEILESCADEKMLNISEQYWIKKLDSQNREIGYNIADGGTGGDTFSNNPNKEEWRIKNGKATLGKKKPHSDEAKKNIAAGNKLSWQLNPRQGTTGKVWTPEERAKASASKIGKILPKKECLYCKRMIDPGNYKQYHGDNCKIKNADI